MNAKETTSIMAIALAVVMLAGLAIVPALTEQKADAVCKPKKPKDNVNAVTPEPSLTQVKKTCEPPVIDIKCDGFKKNGDVCKPSKVKL